MQRFISPAYVAQYDSEDKRQDVSFKYTFDKDTELVGNMNLKLWVAPVKRYHGFICRY